MPTFNYTARNKTGEKNTGSLSAADRREVMAQLSRKGLTPISITEAAGKTKKADAGPKKRFKLERRAGKAAKLSLKQALIFSRELSDLLASGMTLGTALASMARRNASTEQGEITTQLRDDIIGGASLSEALGKHPGSFPHFYISIVRAGEASGQLSESLNNLVTHYERMLEAREKVFGALVYPVIVLVIGMATIIFLLTFVIPRFAIIFQDLNAVLPGPTRFLINSSNFLVQYGIIILALVVAAFVGFAKWIKTDAGKASWHGFLLRVPVVKGIIRANAFSSFARTLGGLMENGVPVLKALNIAGSTVGNVVISNRVSDVVQKVTDGSSISAPLSEGGVFPELFTDMLDVGEQSGNVPGSLSHIAKRYDDDLNRSLKIFTTVLEPLLMLFMAVLVGFVALSMLLAVFDMTSGLEL